MSLADHVVSVSVARRSQMVTVVSVSVADRLRRVTVVSVSVARRSQMVTVVGASVADRLRRVTVACRLQRVSVSVAHRSHEGYCSQCECRSL